MHRHWIAAAEHRHRGRRQHSFCLVGGTVHVGSRSGGALAERFVAVALATATFCTGNGSLNNAVRFVEPLAAST